MSTFFQTEPQGWKRVPIKFLLEGSKNGAWGGEAGTDQTDSICVRVADFDWQRLRLDLSNPTIRSFGADQFRRLALKEGDLVLEKSGGGEKTPVGRVVMFSGEGLSVTSNFVARVRPVRSVSPKFLLYLLAAQYMSGFSIQFVKQNTGIQNLDDAAMFRSDVWVPDRATQKVIADFLDRETARIDHLIKKKQRLAELLNAKHVAAPLRVMASGMGEIRYNAERNRITFSKLAAGWQRVRVKQVASHMTSGSRGWSNFIQDEGELFLQSGSINRHMGISLKDSHRVSPQSGAESERTKVRNGDTLVCITGGRTGAVGYVSGLSERAYINQHVCLIRPSKEINERLLAQVLFSEIGQLHFKMAQYGLKQGMGFEQVANTAIPLPPREEQERIAAEIDYIAAKARSAVAKVGLSIDRLKEYRSALITAAVTGQIDVATWDKQGLSDHRLDEIEGAMQE